MRIPSEVLAAPLVDKLSLTPSDFVKAVNNMPSSNEDLYQDTPARAQLRSMLLNAAQMGAEVVLAFVKRDASLRYMQCIPQVDGDCTRRYVTVVDVRLTQVIGVIQYRRVNLDTIAGLSIEYRPAA